MSRHVVHTPEAPASPYFSQGVLGGGLLHISGMVGVDSATGALADAEVAGQARQALANCKAVLAAAGASLDDAVEVGILLADPADFPALNEEWARWFPESPPARYVAKLGVDLPGVLVSIRMVATVPPPA